MSRWQEVEKLGEMIDEVMTDAKRELFWFCVRWLFVLGAVVFITIAVVKWFLS